MLVHPPGLVTAAVGVVNFVIESAVSSLGDTVFLDHVRVEGLALAVSGVVASVLLVVVVLALGIGAADVDVEGAGEELGAHAVLGVVDGALGTLGWRAASWGSSGERIVRLLVAVGAGDDDMEVSAVTAKVVSGCGLDSRSPERALEVRNRRWQRAIWAGV